MINFQNKVLIFFGSKYDTTDKLYSDFPHIKFKKIQQTHSDIVVEATEKPINADSHYTSEVDAGLLISTADCLPIMIYCQQTHRVAAVHAGWRGVANQITPKTLQTLISTGSTKKDFQIWVGPHLLQNSFEIELDTFEQLSKAQRGLNTDDFAYSKNNKYYVDLNKILVAQVKTTLGRLPEINFLDIDTKTNSDYYSYRRDHGAKERNLSFICLLG